MLPFGYGRDLVLTVMWKCFDYVAQDPQTYNEDWLLQKCGAMLAMSFEQHIKVRHHYSYGVIGLIPPSPDLGSNLNHALCVHRSKGGSHRICTFRRRRRRLGLAHLDTHAYCTLTAHACTHRLYGFLTVGHPVGIWVYGRDVSCANV